MNDSSTNGYVLDSDCLLKLEKKFEMGKKILNSCKIYAPKSFLYELGEKLLSALLENYNFELVELIDEDHERIGIFIKKIYHNKDLMKKYIRNPNSFKAPHLGECQCAAIAKRFSIPLVLMERKQITLFKALDIEVFHIKEFGLKTLTETQDQESFLKSLWEKENIK